jgi:hypothetical protein
VVLEAENQLHLFKGFLVHHPIVEGKRMRENERKSSASSPFITGTGPFMRAESS